MPKEESTLVDGKGGTVKSFDDTEIYYEVHGDLESGKKPLVFLYGLICAMTQWRYQITWFKKDRPCILLDYRGHHRSKTPQNVRDITVANCAKDVAAVMDHLKIPSAHFISHSMGSNVGLTLAATHPEKVLSLVSICGSVDNPFETMFHTHFGQYVFEFLNTYQSLSPEAAEKLWKKLVANNPVNRAIVSTVGFNPKLARGHDIDMYLENVNKIPLTVLTALLHDMQQSLKSILPKVKCPVLVVSGERDFILPPVNQRTLFESLSKAEWMSVPYGSHCAHMDMHEFVNLRVDKFHAGIENS